MDLKTFQLVLAGGLLMTAPASAADIVGTWQRSDGAARIRMAECGGAVCAHITWLKGTNTPAKVGQRVFYDLKADGGGWSGGAFNPEDGKDYSAKASVSGANMTTKGCVMGGLICKSASWVRVN